MSSVLGLGAAGLHAAAMGASSLGRKGKQKQIKTPQPSSQDYLNSYLTTIGNQKLSDKQRAEALFGGPIKSVSGDFYYGGPPKKIPEGAFVVQGQPLTQGARTPNRGYYTREIDTYQVISPQVKEKPRPQEQATQLRLDLSQGGRVDRLNTKDIEHAVAGGASMKDIRQAAKSQDLWMTAKAKSRLEQAPQEQAPQLRLDLSQGGRDNRLNTKDIKHAVAEGASMKDIRQAAKSQDIRMSAKAKSMLQKSKKKDK